MPCPVSSTSTTTSSERHRVGAVRRVRRPPGSIASSALSMSAISTWISCSAFAVHRGAARRVSDGLDHVLLVALMVLEEEQRVLDHRVDATPAPCASPWGG